MKFKFVLKTLKRNRKLTPRLAFEINKASHNTRLVDIFYP